MTASADSISVLLKIVGEQVRKYRQLAGMTQDDLSDKCGLYRTYLSRLENGSVNPTLAALRAVAVALGVDPVELMHEQEPMRKPKRSGSASVPAHPKL